jgi:hypothetical protein
MSRHVEGLSPSRAAATKYSLIVIALFAAILTVALAIAAKLTAMPLDLMGPLPSLLN